MSYHAHELLATLAAQARSAAAGALQFQHGEIDTYDPETATVTVVLQPDGLRTGDVQFLTPWAGVPDTSTNTGTGMLCGPEKGMQVLVIKLDDEGEHLICFPSTFNETNYPPQVPAGEWWLLKSGDAKTYVKLVSGGKTQIGGKTEVDVIAPLVQLSDTIDTLGPDYAVVRRKDLQAVIDDLNDLKALVKAHDHIGNMGAPTPLDPTYAADPRLNNTPDAGASSVAQAK